MQFAFFVEWEQIAGQMWPIRRYLLSPLVSSGKRQTIDPALAQDGKPYMVFGTPGADTQPRRSAPRVTVS